MSQLSSYSLTVPEGRESTDGYVILAHGAQYSLAMANDTGSRCDVELFIDGSAIGTWRINAHSAIRIERPVHDTGRFTFYRAGTVDGEKAGIVVSEHTGLLRAVFKPESTMLQARAGRASAGGTGLSGHSEQTFRSVAALEYDERNFVTINLRLIALDQEPRPLFLKSTPVPPPVQRAASSRN